MIVAHVDMDAFFAAVEERSNPHLVGQPIAVGADPQNGQGRGIVATANYPARAYGLHSAQPIRQAWALSENARRRGQAPVVFLSGNIKSYGAASDRIMQLLRRYSPLVEERSVDEAYLDLSHCSSFAAAIKICQQIKAAIKQQEKITASIGLGPNKLIAKIASDSEKPNGLTIVPPEKVLDWLAPMPLRVIPGVGPKTAQLLTHHGLHTIADARTWTREQLTYLLGSWGDDLYDKLRGYGSATIHTEPAAAKSLGEQTTFNQDTRSPTLITTALTDIAHHLKRRMQQEQFPSGKTIVLTVRFADFTTQTRSYTPLERLTTLKQIQRAGLKLLLPYFDRRRNPQQKLIRLIGLRLERRTNPHPLV